LFTDYLRFEIQTEFIYPVITIELSRMFRGGGERFGAVGSQAVASMKNARLRKMLGFFYAFAEFLQWHITPVALAKKKV